MRLLSTILVTYILLLTAAPSLAMVVSPSKTENCKTHSCCRKKQQQNRKAPVSQHKGCCNNGVCNPFMSCCNCYALATNNRLSPALAASDQQFSTLTENPNSAFLSDTWHPPKSV